MNNILYLLNHKTLTDFEVPIINKRGFGVFIPKKYSSLSKVNSINLITTNFYDNFLDIDSNDLTVLNEIDWFNNEHILSSEHIAILNRNFSFIFITLLTAPPLLTQLVEKFKGFIYYRFFGLPGNMSYVTLVKDFNILSNPKVKYIFSYPEIYNFELTKSESFNQSNSYIIPLGLSNSLILSIQNTYNPKSNKISFVCSRTDEKGYYYNIYQKFITQFEGYEFVILGKNNDSIADLPYVKNNLPDEEYYKCISECACMYYHSVESRHLHYHPLEAMVIGIPIIFHDKSLLSSYLSSSPGKCKDIGEIRDKIDRIVSNQSEFIDDIITSQQVGIKKLTQKYNRNSFNVSLKIDPVQCHERYSPDKREGILSEEPVSDELTRIIMDVPKDIQVVLEEYKIKLSEPKYPTYIQYGMGDILFLIILQKQGNFGVINFNLAYFNKSICNYFTNPCNALEFRIKMFLELDVKVNYMYIDNVWTNGATIDNLIKGITDYKLKYFPISQTIIGKPYIIFHTKARLGSDVKIRLPIVKEYVKNILSEFKSKYQIVLMGERDSFSTEKLCQACIDTFYEEMLTLKKNNDIIDLTSKSIHDNLNFEDWRNHVSIIKNAECNFIFGWGGSFCLSLIFGKKCLTYIDTINYEIILNDGNLNVNNTYLYRDITKFKNKLIEEYGK